MATNWLTGVGWVLYLVTSANSFLQRDLGSSSRSSTLFVGPTGLFQAASMVTARTRDLIHNLVGRHTGRSSRMVMEWIWPRAAKYCGDGELLDDWKGQRCNAKSRGAFLQNRFRRISLHTKGLLRIIFTSVFISSYKFPPFPPVKELCLLTACCNGCAGGGEIF